MNITSKDTMIFVKEDEKGKHYRAGLSTKNVKGEFEQAYIDIKMPKSTNIENKTKINITKGFLSFYNYTGKDDKQHTIWYIVVLEYTTGEVTKIENVSSEQLDMTLPF